MNEDLPRNLGSTRAKQLLGECAALLPADDSLAVTLRAAARRLDEPMRLAVVGQIKRGKSTLVNALICEDIVATGRPELTFNVNELHFAEAERIVVHFRDGSPPRKVTRDEMGYWTNYDPSHLPDLRRVLKVSFGLPNDLLSSLVLIDTPGLGSVHVADSSATLVTLGSDADAVDPGLREALNSLGREPATVHRESFAELDQADAVLYLFSRGIGEEDRKILAEMAGNHPDALTPLKAFGVLNKCDDAWPPDRDEHPGADPLTFHPLRDDADAVVERHLGRPDVRRFFYVIMPIAARVAMGACSLDSSQLNWLDDLSRADPGKLAAHLSDERRFAESTDYQVPAAARQQLVECLGPWGIHMSCQALRNGFDEEKLRGHLMEESGVGKLRKLAGQHFGNRATLIKLSQAVRSVRAGLAVPRSSGHSTVERIGRRIEALERSEQGFVEITALSAYYRDRLTELTETEISHLLEVTGERGTHCACRLGLDINVSLATMAETAIERIRYWTARSNDPILGREGRQTGHTLIRCYENIADRIHKAMQFLEMVE